MEKLIITAALTGNVPTRDHTPHVPLTPEEIAQDVSRCYDAGASIFHIHARDIQARPTLDLDVFKKTARLIKTRNPEAILQLSTGARAGKDWEARANPVRLLPEMASFTTGSNNLPGIVYENAPDFIRFLAEVFRDTGVKPEIEVFETGMINNALHLVKKGLLAAPLHFDFVLGAPGAMPGTVKNLVFLAGSLPPDSTWTVAGIGKAEIPLSTAAIAMGGHVRVGIEDNLRLPDGTLATNAQLVDIVTTIAQKMGRDIATPNEARRILSLDPENKDRILTQID
jgi:3-keto-5-aminohexanoate cleavage enzyme